MTLVLPLLAWLVAVAPTARATPDALLRRTEGVLGRDEVVGGGGAEQLARSLVDREQWDVAAPAWAAARDAGADPDTAWTWEVVSLVESEQWELAQLVALSALAEAPTDDQRHLLYGWLMCRAGAERGARRIARLRHDEGGGDQGAGAAVLELRALRHAGRAGSWARARRRLLRTGSPDAWLWMESSIGHFLSRDPEALVDLERAVQAPQATGQHVAAAIDLRAAVGDHRRAIDLALAGLVRFPDDRALGARAAIAATHPEAAAWLDEVLHAAPDRAEAYELRGARRLAQGDAAGARDDLATAVALGRRTASVRGLHATALAELGLDERALSVLDEATDAFPDHDGLARERLELARRVGSPGARLMAAEAVLRAAPEAPSAELEDGAIQDALLLGRPDELLRWTERALAWRPHSELALRARAVALGQLQRPDEALDAWETVHARLPTDPDVLVGFAGFLLSPGGALSPDPARARSLARRAVELRPTAGSLQVLAAAAWALGDRDEAVARQRDAVRLSPDDDGLKRRLQLYTGELP
ncbi:MAG: hypothetical protein H6742_01280 [Alphaproteobacteria bacterium]|nr:hypothetical protein [Alphaproteobacteria bacterium]